MQSQKEMSRYTSRIRITQPPTALADPSPCKILLYSHDTFGLGNIRRTLLLTQDLVNQYPKAAILIVTGSPMIHAFRIPDGVDYIKLPCLDRVDAERYEPRFLLDCSQETFQHSGIRSLEFT